MARRKTITTDELAHLPVFVSPAPTQPTMATTQTPTEERRERELDELLDIIGNDGRLTVWHIIDGKSVYAGNMTLDGFSLDALLDTFGGGDKSLVFYQGNKKVETLRVSLDPMVPAKNPKYGKALAATPTPATTAQPGLADLSALIAAMGQAQINSMSIVQQMQTQSANNMQTMLTAMTTMMAARPHENPLEMVKTVVEMLKGNTNGASVQAKDLLEMFERGMKLANDAGGKDEGDGVMGIVGEGVKTLGALVEGIVAEKKANAARLVAQPQAALPGPSDEVGDGVPRSEPTPTEGQNTMATPPAERPVWLPPNTNADALWSVAQYLQPNEAATLINGRLSDAQFDALITDIETPGFGDRLPRYFPSLANADPNWIGEVIRILLSQYVEVDGDTNTGDESNETA